VDIFSRTQWVRPGLVGSRHFCPAADEYDGEQPLE
jgi:hypothetical protein